MRLTIGRPRTLPRDRYDDFIEVAVDDKTYYFSPRVAKLKKKPRYIQFLASIGNSTIVNNLRTLIFAQQKHENHPERYKELRGKLISHLEQEADRFEMMFEPRFNATSKMLSLVRGRGASNKKNRAPALDHPSPEEIFHEAVNEIMTGSGMNAQFMSIQAATKAFAKDDVSAKEVIASAMRQAKEAGASQDDVFKYAAWAYVRATNSLQLEDKHQQEKMDEYVTHDVEILRAKPGLPGLDDAGGRETQLRSELLKENDLVNVDKLRTKYLVNMFEKDTGQVCLPVPPESPSVPSQLSILHCSRAHVLPCANGCTGCSRDRSRTSRESSRPNHPPNNGQGRATLA